MNQTKKENKNNSYILIIKLSRKTKTEITVFCFNLYYKVILNVEKVLHNKIVPNSDILNKNH